MSGVNQAHALRHRRMLAFVVLTAATLLIAFRASVELGYAPGGSLRIRGVPLEYFVIIWFLILLVLSADARPLSDGPWRRAALYQWSWGVVGLAGLLWLFQDLERSGLIRSASWVYWVAAAGVLAVFLSSCTIKPPIDLSLVRNFLPDAARILARPASWFAGIAGLAILAAAPRSLEVPAGGRAFERWYSRQVRLTVPASWQVSPVTLVELVDYQCPSCRQANLRYAPVIRAAKAQYAGTFAAVTIDFPLENECNDFGRLGQPGGLHLAACEAAAAVRLAREAGSDREREVIDWLWTHQSILTPATVFTRIQDEFGIDVRGRYEELLPRITREALKARALGLSGTPTFLLNGRRLPLLTPESLEAAIDIEVRLTQNERTGTQ